MYLLDTNVLSEYRKPRAHGAVLAWTASVQSRDLHISAVSFGEMQGGLEMTRKQNVEKAQQIERWLDRLEATHRVVPVDASMYRLWARFMVGQSNTLAVDALIAATAASLGFTVVTRNVKDFAPFDVEVLNPFDYKGERGH